MVTPPKFIVFSSSPTRILCFSLHPARICVYRRDEAASRPKNEFVPKTLAELNIEGIGSHEGLANGGRFITSNNTHKTKIHQNSNSKFNNNDKNYDRTNRRHPDNMFTNITNFDISNSNNNNYNSIFSSQQNLAKTNIIHSSNLTRNRNFGSQQSLSTASNHSTSTNSSHRTNQINNYNSNTNGNSNSSARGTVHSTDLLLNLNSTSSATSNHYTSNHTSNLISSLNDINSISTDAWLNAWNSPPAVQRASSTVPNVTGSSDFAIQSYHNHTTTTSNRNLLSNFNSQNGHSGDPWKGDFMFIFVFFRSSSFYFFFFFGFCSSLISLLFFSYPLHSAHFTHTLHDFHHLVLF